MRHLFGLLRETYCQYVADVAASSLSHWLPSEAFIYYKLFFPSHREYRI